MRNLRTIFLINESEAPNEDLDMVIEAIKDGNSQSAHYHMLRLLHTELSQICNEKLPQSYFRFCGLSNEEGYEGIKKDLENGRISLSNPFSFNDPMDPLLKVWIDMHKNTCEKFNYKYFKIAKNALKNLRICCMSNSNILDSNHPLMWSHYADSHRGIAIKYAITKEVIDRFNDGERLLRLCSVRYKNHKELNEYISMDNALLAKAACWNYEAEHRLLYFSANNEDFKTENRRKNYISLDGFIIKEIYLGALIDSHKESEIKKIVNKIGARVFKMKYDSSDITKLKTEEIKVH